MPPDILALLLIALTYVLIVACVYWDGSDDAPRTPLTSAGMLAIGGDRAFHRVPLHNLHRSRGRHRAY